MYRLMVESTFAAAHQLRGYKGRCESLHGHNWRVQVMVKTGVLDVIGMGIDFGLLKTHLKEIMNHLDHKFLNDIQPFTDKNPSSENLACYIFTAFAKRLDSTSVKMDWVRVWESDTAYAQYNED